MCCQQELAVVQGTVVVLVIKMRQRSDQGDKQECHLVKGREDQVGQDFALLWHPGHQGCQHGLNLQICGLNEK